MSVETLAATPSPRRLPARVHLDPVGGIAGDMFVAAITDAFPSLIPDLLAELSKLPHPAGTSYAVVDHRDAVLRGRRFVVDLFEDATESRASHRGTAATSHSHRHFSSIRRLLEQTPLVDAVRAHALGLFHTLAVAEAHVHGVDVERVAFHEVGAWDSIVDFVAAAFLIAALDGARWSWSPLPLGGGRVDSQHGLLPIPAPATTLLLQSMTVIDDGISGERVTPTGAAILRYLQDTGRAEKSTTALTVIATGNGFGTKTFSGLSNICRCLAFGESAMHRSEELIDVIQFEVDDQSAEDLALALENLRQTAGVVDVVQSAVIGKKGRLTTHIQVLALPGQRDRIVDMCFMETATIGLRIHAATRRVLPRQTVVDAASGATVKIATRPDGTETRKVESADLASVVGGRAMRDAHRRALESAPNMPTT